MKDKRCSFCGNVDEYVIENPSGDKAICISCLQKFSKKPEDHERID